MKYSPCTEIFTVTPIKNTEVKCSRLNELLKLKIWKKGFGQKMLCDYILRIHINFTQDSLNNWYISKPSSNLKFIRKIIMEIE